MADKTLSELELSLIATRLTDQFGRLFPADRFETDKDGKVYLKVRPVEITALIESVLLLTETKEYTDSRVFANVNGEGNESND